MKIDNQHEFNIADEYAKGQLYQAGKTAENYTASYFRVQTAVAAFVGWLIIGSYMGIDSWFALLGLPLIVFGKDLLKIWKWSNVQESL